jgi:hypothetical protein
MNRRPKKFQGVGDLTVYFHYTSGIGNIAPPAKIRYKMGGATVARVVHTKVTAPKILSFEMPNAHSRLAHRFDKVVAFGLLDATIGARRKQ